MFLSPATGTARPPFSLTGFLQAAQSLGFGLIWHSFQGTALVVLSIAALALSFKRSSSRGVRISAVLGTVSVFAAAIGGLLFVLSGFSNGGNSMQMGEAVSSQRARSIFWLSSMRRSSSECVSKGVLPSRHTDESTLTLRKVARLTHRDSHHRMRARVLTGSRR